MTTTTVCKKELNSTTEPLTTLHKGRTYYFCTKRCQQRFMANPERYSCSAGNGSLDLEDLLRAGK